MNSRNLKTTTKGVESLLGNPKKALIRLAVPNTISLLVTVIYQITDILWISGLGADALAVTGFFMPFFLFINAIAVGLSAGGGIKIAQYIGAWNKDETDKTAAHIFLFTVVLSIPILVLIFIFAEPVLLFMRAGKLLGTSLNVVYLFTPCVFLFIFNQTAGSILTNEGDAKRMMSVSIFGLILNILLDPVLIYYFKFGIYGAVLAIIVANTAAAFIYIFWFFIKKNTYVAFRFKGFKLDTGLSLSIIKLGYPLTFAQIVGAVSVFAITSIISHTVGTDGVAVYSTGLRYAGNVLLPSYGIAYAVITVAAAAFGRKDYEKLKFTYYFALRAGLVITISIAIATYFFAPQISSLFTWSKGSSRIATDLITFLKIYAWFFPAISIWMTSICFFAGIGYTIFDIIFNFIKHMLFVIPLVYLFAIVLNYGLPSIWTIVVIGMWIHSFIAFVLLRTFLSRYKRTGLFAL